MGNSLNYANPKLIEDLIRHVLIFRVHQMPTEKNEASSADRLAFSRVGHAKAQARHGPGLSALSAGLRAHRPAPAGSCP